MSSLRIQQFQLELFQEHIYLVDIQTQAIEQIVQPWVSQRPPSSAETPECWTPQVQTEAIFADNLDIKGKLSANMASVWTWTGVQHSGVSAGLLEYTLCNEQYLSIPRYTGSLGNRFQETHVIRYKIQKLYDIKDMKKSLKLKCLTPTYKKTQVILHVLLADYMSYEGI